MSNTAKARGTQWERAVQDYLTGNGHATRRMPAAGSKDVGDLQTEDGFFAIECKNTKSIDLAKAIDEAVTEGNRCQRIGVAVIKRRNKSASAAYVVMTLSDFKCILDSLNREQIERV